MWKCGNEGDEFDARTNKFHAGYTLVVSENTNNGAKSLPTGQQAFNNGGEILNNNE
jgi:hypothetical protein